jgi:crotonobetainyl-CoA:carnitine CoA-transferase CaiB-like acyl-CoA transferase
MTPTTPTTAMTAMKTDDAMTARPGPLDGRRVVELASEHAAFAGKLLAELGAEVVVVEPPGGHHSRSFEPFVDDRPGAERSLWWWHYNASKLGVVLDLDDERDRDRFRRLVATADVVLEGEPPARLGALGIDHADLRAARPELIWVSVTPFGRDGPRAHEPAVDLTVLAGGGPVWSCGYDDHSLPPVRGGGNQGYQTACLWAVLGALTAVVVRDRTGVGQHVDVSMHAAANVTTEAASYEWLVARRTVQRQTGRHAGVQPTMSSRAVAADGRDVHTGVPPRRAEELRALLDWLTELGLRDEFEEAFFLELGIQRGEIHFSEIGRDAEATAIFGACRGAVSLIASKLSAHDFFVGAQRRGLACGIVAAPEEVIENEHFVARRFPVPVFHDDLGREVVYPGAPFLAPASPWRLTRRAPHVGEHDDDVLGPLR